MNKRGFSLIELQISILIASVLVISIGMVSQISMETYNKYRQEAQIFNDISYGFKFLQSKIRGSGNVIPSTLVAETDYQWIGQPLQIDNEVFGLYQKLNDEGRDFVYVKDADDITNRDTLFSLAAADNPQWSVSYPTAQTVQINLNNDDGAEIPFDLSTRIKRRVQ